MQTESVVSWTLGCMYALSLGSVLCNVGLFDSDTLHEGLHRVRARFTRPWALLESPYRQIMTLHRRLHDSMHRTDPETSLINLKTPSLFILLDQVTLLSEYLFHVIP